MGLLDAARITLRNETTYHRDSHDCNHRVCLESLCARTGRAQVNQQSWVDECLCQDLYPRACLDSTHLRVLRSSQRGQVKDFDDPLGPPGTDSVKDRK